MQGKLLFDGPMCRLESHAQHAQLELAFSRTSYKPFLGTNLSDPTLPESQLSRPTGVSAALRSGDGYWIFGLRNANVAYYPARVHPLAGAAAWHDDAPPDVFADVRRELFEEAAISSDELSDVHLVGIVEDHQVRQPELIFDARTTLWASEIAARLHAEEHDQLLWFPPSARSSLLMDARLTPVAKMCVMLT